MTDGNSSPPVTSSDDVRLDGWYHTIELGDGLVTRGYFDHRSVVGATGIPERLDGKSCLDVGTANGYYAFEMESRGAERVVAVDVRSSVEWDWLPQFRHAVSPDPMEEMRRQFELARQRLRSRVEYHESSVYDLSPDSVGMFDVVMCGSLLLHLQSPLRALAAIRSVTRELAVIEVCLDDELESRMPEHPLLHFGSRPAEVEPGEACTYWRFNTAALVEMMEYAGFDTEPMTPYRLPHADLLMRTALGRPRAIGTRPGWHFTAADHAARSPSRAAPPLVRDTLPYSLEDDDAMAPLLAAARDELLLPSGLLGGGRSDGATAIIAEHNVLAEARDYADHLLAEIERRDRHAEGVTAYVRHLEAELADKERYIAELEDRVRAAEPGPS